MKKVLLSVVIVMIFLNISIQLYSLDNKAIAAIVAASIVGAAGVGKVGYDYLKKRDQDRAAANRASFAGTVSSFGSSPIQEESVVPEASSGRQENRDAPLADRSDALVEQGEMFRDLARQQNQRQGAQSIRPSWWQQLVK